MKMLTPSYPKLFSFKSIKNLCYGISALGLAFNLSVQTVNAAPDKNFLDRQENYYGLFLSGQYASKLSNFNLASEYLLEATRRSASHLDEMDPVLVEETRNALLRSGKYQDAITFSLQLKKVKHLSTTTVFLITAYYANENQWESARDFLNQQNGSRITSLMKPFLKAWLSAGLGQKDRALSELTVIQERMPAYHNYFKGLILTQLGQHKDALKAFAPIQTEQDLFQLPNILFRAYLRSLIALNQTEKGKDLLAQYINIHGRNQFLESDQRKLLQGEELPPLINSIQEGIAETFYQLAQYFEAPDLPPVYDLFRIADYLNPRHVNVKLSIAGYQTRQHRYIDAIGTYDQLLKITPNLIEIKINQAEAMYEDGKKSEAIEALERFALKNPGDTQALFTIAGFYNREQNYTKMADVVERLLKRIPNTGPQHWIYYYYQGIAYERLKDWDKAETALLKALELNPDQPDALNYLGYSWVDKGLHLQKAQEMLVKAVNKRRNSGAIADSLGWAYFKLGKYKDAVTLLERAVALDPAESVIVEHLGDAYWKVGRKREARFQWNRAIKWPTPDVDIKAVEKKLIEGL